MNECQRCLPVVWGYYEVIPGLWKCPDCGKEFKKQMPCYNMEEDKLMGGTWEASGRYPDNNPIGELLMGMKQRAVDKHSEEYPDNNPKSITGVKKVPLHLNPPSALIYMALGFKDGATKYGPFNWRDKDVAISVYMSAVRRHLEAYWDGEEDATDSGYPHLAHALACLAILVDAKESGSLVDDRPTAGGAPRLLHEWEEK